MPIRTYLPVTALIAAIILCLIFGLPIAVGIVFAVLVTLVTVKGLGHAYPEQLGFGFGGVKQTKPVLMILSLVGFLIPLMMMGGTIPAIIYYGLGIVNTSYLLTLSFLLTAAVSCLLGTSVGTLSTIGLSLIGIAHAAQVPLGMMAGALISGAMVGERFSPLSSSRLLVISSIAAHESVGRFSRTTGLLGAGLTAVLFLILDLMRASLSAEETINTFQQLMQQHFSISIVNLIPLIVMIGAFSFRIKAIPALLLGIAASGLLVLFGRPIAPDVFFKAILFGYELGSNTDLDKLVHGGGLWTILQVLIVIGLAGFLNGILTKANLVKPIVDRMIGHTNRASILVAKAVLLSLFVVAITCNQTVPLLVLSSTLMVRFAGLPHGNSLLGRTILDSTLVMPVLVPWNGLAMLMSVTLGVSTLAALPYLFFPLLLPVITIVYTRFKEGQNIRTQVTEKPI